MSKSVRPEPRSGQRKLAEIARDQMLLNIRSGRWPVGAQIPTEAELTKLFGMSRAPVREALQSLALLGVLDVSPRRGTYVQPLPSSSVVDMGILSSIMGVNNPVADLFEFRASTEASIAELAARNVTALQISHLRSVINENVAALAAEDPSEVQRVDVRFHKAIAVASENVVFQGVVAALSGLLTDLRRTIGGIPGASAQSYVEHRIIFEAIARHDTASARRAAEAHVRATEARYMNIALQVSDKLQDGRTTDAAQE